MSTHLGHNIDSADELWEYMDGEWRPIDCDDDVYAVTATITDPETEEFVRAVQEIAGEPEILNAQLVELLPENNGTGLCPSTGATIFRSSHVTDSTTGIICACMFSSRGCNHTHNDTLPTTRRRAKSVGTLLRSTFHRAAALHARATRHALVETKDMSDANLTAFFCPYNAATECEALNMTCPGYTSDATRQETWSEECLTECAARLSDAMDLKITDNNATGNGSDASPGSVDFVPRTVTVDVETEIIFSGDGVHDRDTGAFLPSGDHSCMGAASATASLSGAVVDRKMNITPSSAGTYKLCIKPFNATETGDDAFRIAGTGDDAFHLANGKFLTVQAADVVAIPPSNSGQRGGGDGARAGQAGAGAAGVGMPPPGGSGQQGGGDGARAGTFVGSAPAGLPPPAMGAESTGNKAAGATAGTGDTLPQDTGNPLWCSIAIGPTNILAHVQTDMTTSGVCIDDGDVTIFAPVTGAAVDEWRRLAVKRTTADTAADDGRCSGAADAAKGTRNGGVLTDGSVSVNLTEGSYQLCIAKEADFVATGGHGFNPAFWDSKLARLVVGQGDNIRTRPWEPHVYPDPPTHEEDECTVSDIFCRHNRSATEITSTAEAGQVETARPAGNDPAIEGDRSLSDFFGGIGGGQQGDDGQHGGLVGGPRAGDVGPLGGPVLPWLSGENSPETTGVPTPPPPPLSPGQAWQDHECDVASWLCSKNRTSAGKGAFGPGGVSRWKSVTTGTPTAVGIAWWWILIMLGVLLCCCCCVFCFLGCQRRNLAPTPGVGEVVTAPIISPRWAGPACGVASAQAQGVRGPNFGGAGAATQT